MQRPRSHPAVAEGDRTAIVRERAEVRDARGGAGSEELDRVVEHLLDRQAALLDRHAPFLGKRHHRLPRDARQDRVSQGGRHQRAARQHREQVAGGAFLQVALLGGVQKDRLHAACGLRLFLGQGADDVVARALDPAGAAGRGAHPVGGGGGGVAVQVEVRADGRVDDDHPRIQRQVDADTGLRVGERADVDGAGADEVVPFPRRVVGGREAELPVALDHLLDGPDERVGRVRRHEQPLHRARHAQAVVEGPEQRQRSVRLRECLEALEAGQPVLGREVDQGELLEPVAVQV